jgi:hypothetical protein
MKNLADHLLDIVQNSIDAEAIRILIALKFNDNNLLITIQDNGRGMDQETVQKIKDPFYTTRTSRKVGLGLALLEHNCTTTGGYLRIESEVGVGTKLEAILQTDSIDMIPSGDIPAAISMLICNNKTIDIFFSYQNRDRQFEISTEKILQAVHPITLDAQEVRNGIKKLIETNITR